MIPIRPVESEGRLEQLTLQSVGIATTIPIEVCREALGHAGDVGNRAFLAALDRYRGEGLPRGGSGERDIVQQAINELEVALDSRNDVEVTPEEGREKRASLHHHLGNLYLSEYFSVRTARIERAIGHYEAALRIRSMDQRPVLWASTQLRLGQALMLRERDLRERNLERAIIYLDAALRIFQQTEETEKIHSATRALAEAYAMRVARPRIDNLRMAVHYYELAAQNVEYKSGSWREIQYRLGSIYRSQVSDVVPDGLVIALRYYRAALRGLTIQEGPEEWAKVQHSMGVALAAPGPNQDLDGAIRCYSEALTARPVESHPVQCAVTLRNLADALVARHAVAPSSPGTSSDLDCATRRYEEALYVFNRYNLRLDAAVTQHNLALAVRGRGKSAHDPRSLLTSALDQFEGFGLHQEAMTAARNLAHLLAEMDSWAASAQAYSRALTQAEKLYEAALSVGLRPAQLALQEPLHHGAAFAYAKSGDPSKAVIALEQGRAKALGMILERDLADLVLVARRHPELYETYLVAVEWVKQVENRERIRLAHRANLDGTPFRDEHELPQNDLRNNDEPQRDRDLAQKELHSAIADIRALPGMSRFLEREETTTILNSVHGATPLIYIACTEFGTCVIILRSDGLGKPLFETAALTDFTGRQLASLLLHGPSEGSGTGYLAGISAPVSSGVPTVLTHLLHVLSEAFARQLTIRLSELEVENAILIPCGLLASVPLHAVQSMLGDQLTRLVDVVTIAYAPSARMLRSCRILSGRADGREPIFTGLADSQPFTDPLPFSRLEVAFAASRFHSETVLFGKDAGDADLFTYADRSTHLHLAVHGAYDMTEPLNSWLDIYLPAKLTLASLLAGPGLMGVRLVVASGCDTAVAEHRRMPDEVFGLTTGFLAAGSAGAIGTLWRVEDLPTSLLMMKFYDVYLRTSPNGASRFDSPQRSLRAAQVWLASLTRADAGDFLQERAPDLAQRLDPAIVSRLLDSARDVLSAYRSKSTPFGDPYYWAGFVYFGA